MTEGKQDDPGKTVAISTEEAGWSEAGRVMESMLFIPPMRHAILSH